MLDLEICAKNFFLDKISPFEEDGQLLTRLIDTDDYIESFGKKKSRVAEKPTNPPANKKARQAVVVHHRSEEEERPKCAVSNEAEEEEFEKCNQLVSLSVYFTWFVLTVHAYIREFLRYYGFEKNKAAVERPELRDFAPLVNSFEAIYARNCYMRVRDVFERPIGGVPGGTVKLVDRETDDYCWTFKFPGTQTEVINAGSYNYLGFAQSEGPCAEEATKAIEQCGLTNGGAANEIGQPVTQDRLEALVAEFLGVESAICFNMGFATNSMNMACFVNKDSLIISDQYNHASIILGARITGAAIRVFKHNDVRDLERVLRDAIVNGNRKRGGTRFDKILVVVEGIYSMEGSMCRLPDIIALKRKYKFYLYLDEAHSIGATGRTGRGVVEHWGCRARDVDILMGTFTKSFGAAGGYLAGSKAMISHIRRHSPAGYYSTPISPPVAQQIHTAMSIIMGRDGTDCGTKRIERLRINTQYMRLRLKQMGFIVYGSDHSPIIPIMIYHPTKCGLWGRLMLERKVAVVVVSFPATAMTESRCRICISAAHTKAMLDQMLEAVDEVGDISMTKHSQRAHLYREIEAKWEEEGGEAEK